MILTKKFAGLQPGMDYKLISEGRDYYQISWNGKPTNVPKYYFQGKVDRRYLPEEEEEEDYGYLL